MLKCPLCEYNLIGFNNRKYDNHILHSCVQGYSDEQLYNISQKIIDGYSTNAWYDSNNSMRATAFTPKRIIHSGPATIVFWEDGTKTAVKLSKNDIYDEYDAFTAALAIKIFGSNSAVKKLIKKVTESKNEK